MAKRIRTNGLPIVERKAGRWAEYIIRKVPIPFKWRDDSLPDGLSRWAANLAIPPQPTYRVTRLFRFGKRRNAGMRTYATLDEARAKAREWYRSAERKGRIENGLLG